MMTQVPSSARLLAIGAGCPLSEGEQLPSSRASVVVRGAIAAAVGRAPGRPAGLLDPRTIQAERPRPAPGTAGRPQTTAGAVTAPPHLTVTAPPHPDRVPRHRSQAHPTNRQ